jgi:Domain of unknown function (DUF397).
VLDQTWRKSSRSSTQGSCVEVRQADNRIEVRDSKRRAGHVLAYAPPEWEAFLDGAKHGVFDL